MLIRYGTTGVAWIPMITIGATVITTLLLMVLLRTDEPVVMRGTMIVICLLGGLRTAFLFRLCWLNGNQVNCWSLFKRQSLSVNGCRIEERDPTVFSVIMFVLNMWPYVHPFDARGMRLCEQGSKRCFFVGYTPYGIGREEALKLLHTILGVPVNPDLTQKITRETQHNMTAIVILLLVMSALAALLWATGNLGPVQ